MPGRRKQQRYFHGNHFLISSENQIVSNDFTDRLYTPLFFICNPLAPHFSTVSPHSCSFIRPNNDTQKRKSPGSLRYSHSADPGPFSNRYSTRSAMSGGLSRDRFAHGSLSVNQVESAFIPLRSMLFPSHTAKAMGTDIPALNCVSFASLVSRLRLMTTRQVGPV